MKKVLSLFKRKKGTTREQFREYYENNHVKIFKDLHGLAGYERYVRRYLTPFKRWSPHTPHLVDFDVVMENWFSPELYKRFFETPQPFDSDFLRTVANDEEKFFDRTQMFVHNIEEYETHIGGNRVNSVGDALSSDIKKVVILGTKKEGMTPEQFKDYYEDRHVRLVEKHLPLPGVARYARRYLSPMIDIISGRTPSSGIDVITELWFSDSDLFEKYVTGGALLDPQATALIAADEDRFLKRDAMVEYTIEECDTFLAQSSLTGQRSFDRHSADIDR